MKGGGAQAGGVRNFWHRPKIKVVWYDEPLCQNSKRYSKVKYHGIFFRLDPPLGVFAQETPIARSKPTTTIYLDRVLVVFSNVHN